MQNASQSQLLEYGGLKLRIPQDVYIPSDDSFMLADAASSLKKNKVLEIGCGSGFVSLSCAHCGNNVIGIDINPVAVECARLNATRNKISNAKFVLGDLFDITAPNSKLEKDFDAILFNPPYLPTSEDEKITGHLNSAYDGGKDGRLILDRFLDSFDRYLRPGGCLFLVQSSLNDDKATEVKLKAFGYSIEVMRKESYFFETLSLIKAKKPSN